GSVAFMLVAALWAAPRTAVVIMLPIATALAFAFEQHRYAYSLAFAPAFFVAFFLLGVFLIARSFFESFARRLGFSVFLGTLTAYFDILHGSIPVALALTIVFDRFFYGRAEDTWRGALLRATMIAVAFAGAFVAFTALRL